MGFKFYGCFLKSSHVRTNIYAFDRDPKQETWKTHQIDLMNAQNAKNKEDQHPQSITSIRKANTGTKRQEGDDRFDEVDIGAAHPTSIGKLFPNDRSLTKVNLICSWSADVLASATIYGEHQLRSIPVRPARKAVECPITISSNYSPTVSHNFEKGPSVSSGMQEGC